MPGHPYYFHLAYSIPITTITKVIPGKKKFIVKWVKKTGASQYQIRYSTKKNMLAARTVLASSKSNSKSIKAKAKKKYYIQVRVAKTIGGQAYWSGWSSKSVVKTKK